MQWMLVYIAIFVPFSTSNSFSQGAQSKPMHGRQTPSTFTHISSKVCVCIPQVSSVVYFLFAVRKVCQLGLSCNHEYEGEVSKEARDDVTFNRNSRASFGTESWLSRSKAWLAGSFIPIATLPWGEAAGKSGAIQRSHQSLAKCTLGAFSGCLESAGEALNRIISLILWRVGRLENMFPL